MPEWWSGRGVSRSGRLRLAVVTTLVVGLATGPLIVLAAGPPAAFSGQSKTISSECGYGCPPIYWHPQFIPAGMNVSFRWSDTSGGSVFFEVVAPGGGALAAASCLWRNASAGDCSFSSEGGEYTFPAANPYPETTQVVNYSGVFHPVVQ
jgi:hypothetical protein